MTTTTPIPKHAPGAAVIRVEGTTVTIRCPLCHGMHVHNVLRLAGRFWRSPGCGLRISGDKRALGYVFVLKGEK